MRSTVSVRENTADFSLRQVWCEHYSTPKVSAPSTRGTGYEQHKRGGVECKWWKVSHTDGNRSKTHLFIQHCMQKQIWLRQTCINTRKNDSPHPLLPFCAFSLKLKEHLKPGPRLSFGFAASFIKPNVFSTSRLLKLCFKLDLEVMELWPSATVPCLLPLLLWVRSKLGPPVFFSPLQALSETVPPGSEGSPGTDVKE